MAEEEDAHAGSAGHVERLDHPPRNLCAAGKLAEDADLHVVDEKCEPPRVAGLLECLRDFEPERVLHRSPFVAGIIAGSDAFPLLHPIGSEPLGRSLPSSE